MYRAIFNLFLFSFLVTILMFAPFSFHIGDRVVNAGDPLFYAWNITHNMQSMSRGFANILDTNIFYPETNTLAYSDTLAAQTVFAIPIYFFTKNAVLAENVYVFLTFPLAALSMFALSYALTKNKAASFVSALFYAFSYARLSQLSHVPAVSSQWLPLVLLFIIQFFERGKFRDLFLSFLFFYASLLSSVYFGVMLGVLYSVILIFYTFAYIRSRHILADRCKKIGFLLVPALMACLVALYPYIRFWAEHPGVVRSFEEVKRASAHLGDYVSVLPDSLMRLSGLPVETGERALYVTLTLLVLFLIGSRTYRKTKDRKTLILIFLTVLAWLLSLGPYLELLISNTYPLSFTLPYYYLYKLIPFVSIIRVPGRFSILFVLGASALAAIGMDAVTRTMPKAKSRIVLGGILMVFLFEIWQVTMHSVKVPVYANMPAVYKWLEHEPERSILVELPLTPLYWGNSIGQQVKKQYDELTVEDMVASETYRVYFSGYHGQSMMNGYSGFFPQTYYDAAYRLASFPSEDAIALLRQKRVTHIVVHLWQYNSENKQEIMQKLTEIPSMRLVSRFGEDYVYTLR